MIKDITYLVISDIHFGHVRTKTSEIVQHLDVYFDNYSSNTELCKLDIIFIAGDLYDSLLDFSQSDIHESTLWLSRLMEFCSRHNIKFRILEGTPSHDRQQSKIAEVLSSVNNLNIDFKYIDTLSIEYLKDLELYILYMPDEWTSSSDLTFRQVQTLLKENNIDQVDIGIFHGVFSYQVKHIPGNIQSHKEENYLPIVRYYINIGHYHTFSVYDRIIAQGSFDRLSHGEEEPKGGVICHISKDSTNNYFNFIENKLAKIYKTIDIRYKDIDKALIYLDNQIGKIPYDSYIRLRASKDHAIFQAMERFKVVYPRYTFTKKTLEDNTDDYHIVNNSILIKNEFVPIMITPDNILDLIMTEVNSNYALTSTQLDSLRNILGETHVQLR